MTDVRDDGDQREHVVLVNDEEQHSLWLAQNNVPAGWRQVFGPGSKAACLQYVEESWKDITPLSVRKKAASNS